MNEILKLAQIGMTYVGRSGKRVNALNDVSLAVREDEFLTIIGPSGCGKSTLLKIFGKIVPATTGNIQFRCKTLTAPTSDIGICFQQPLLFPWHTVERNVLMPMEMLGRSIDKHRGEARDLIELVGLKGFEQSYPRELSGGMQQRVAIARALITDPPLLLMDEPFSALDAMTREELSLEILRIWQERKKTIIFVTHSIPEGVLLSDRLVIMATRPGRIDQIVDIDLPRPRTISMTSTPRFGHFSNLVRDRVQTLQRESK
ncbi:ABC nitrate/sulfonate/bicarbonate transporter, ATPase subunit [Caballeronia sordidicola]|uniref:ABC nitrate/sulfonate/bicarbonate transporter, ATPase subunit n=2 Tax=Caballeronia sordidicola TaxID=196367 RepID=A0A158I780_CABSO|nr:ABC nitrate/sulfonate/bicarbonate transporter, ATPase subunit [Caballeronia sordidicola]